MKTKKKDGKSEEKKKLLNYNRWFIAAKMHFLVTKLFIGTKVVFVAMKQTSDNRICYGFDEARKRNEYVTGSS